MAIVASNIVCTADKVCLAKLEKVFGAINCKGAAETRRKALRTDSKTAKATVATLRETPAANLAAEMMFPLSGVMIVS